MQLFVAIFQLGAETGAALDVNLARFNIGAQRLGNFECFAALFRFGFQQSDYALIVEIRERRLKAQETRLRLVHEPLEPQLIKPGGGKRLGFLRRQAHEQRAVIIQRPHQRFSRSWAMTPSSRSSCRAKR